MCCIVSAAGSCFGPILNSYTHAFSSNMDDGLHPNASHRSECNMAAQVDRQLRLVCCQSLWVSDSAGFRTLPVSSGSDHGQMVRTFV